MCTHERLHCRYSSINVNIPLYISARRRNHTWPPASHHPITVTAIQISPQDSYRSSPGSALLDRGRQTLEKMPPQPAIASPLRAQTRLSTPPGPSMCFVIKTLTGCRVVAQNGTPHISRTAIVQATYSKKSKVTFILYI